MKYRNIVTGLEFESKSEIHCKDLIIVDESPKAQPVEDLTEEKPLQEEKPKAKKPTKKPLKKGTKK
ncbi:MAG: hypothetical protein IIY21_01435 [Clostridiales bacterium]|nr:hypothetical protein [Clostridiales bacterium]